MAEQIIVGKRQTSSGDPNILSLKDSTKIRLIDGAKGIRFKQHTIKHADDPEQIEFVVCPGPKICPLCHKPVRKDGRQNFPVSRRFATNVWDYGSGAVRVLIGGPMIHSEFEAADEVGIDTTSCDWIIHKMGKGLQTKYKLVRSDATPFEEAVGPDDLLNLDKYGESTSPEKIFELLERAGIDYDAIEIQEFTLEEAMQFVLPFGQGRGLTVEQAVAQMPDWCEWLHGVKVQDEQFNDPIFICLHLVMKDRGIVGDIEDTMTASQPPNDETPVESATEDSPPPTGSEQPTLVMLLDTEGREVEVPADAVEPLLAAGFSRIPEPEPEPEPEPAEDPNALVQLVKDGLEIEVPPDAVEPLLAAGYTRVAAAPESEESPAQEQSPETTTGRVVTAGEGIHVRIHGQTIPMAFGAAFSAKQAGTDLEWADPEVEAFATLLASTGGEPPTEKPAGQPAQSEAEAAMHAEAQNPQPEQDDRPFRCDVEGCDWSGKTSGALTQHRNRTHGEVSQQPQGQQATPPPSGDKETVLTRVRTLLATRPEKDYRKLLDLFEEVAGKRDISAFSEQELLALEERLQADAAG
jgi:hypothetical protein